MATADKPQRVIALEPVTEAGTMADIRRLFVEYAASLEIDLCFQGFEAELASLPGKYAPPAGALILARVDSAVAGCVALRPLGDGICEMKRLYVRDAFRGLGVGRTLAERIIAEARSRGYRAIRLDTLGRLVAARALYESLGFREIEPYIYNPTPDVQFMELILEA